MFIDRVMRYVRGADAPTESDSERDGLLSYAAEWHALEIGVFVGLSGQWPLIAALAAFAVGGAELGRRLRDTEHVRDAAKEPGYSAAGVVVGLGVHVTGAGMPPWLGTVL